MEHTTCKDLSKLKVVDLKKMAKSRGLRGYSKLRKGELINLLDSPDFDMSKCEAQLIEYLKKTIIMEDGSMEYCRVIDLKAIAKSIGLRDYSKLRKAELINLLKQSEPFSRR